MARAWNRDSGVIHSTLGVFSRANRIALRNAKMSIWNRMRNVILPNGNPAIRYTDSAGNSEGEDVFEIGETPSPRPGYRDVTEESLATEISMLDRERREAVLNHLGRRVNDEIPNLTPARMALGRENIDAALRDFGGCEA